LVPRPRGEAKATEAGKGSMKGCRCCAVVLVAPLLLCMSLPARGYRQELVKLEALLHPVFIFARSVLICDF
jgi:hypothetical protein